MLITYFEDLSGSPTIDTIWHLRCIIELQELCLRVASGSVTKTIRLLRCLGPLYEMI